MKPIALGAAFACALASAASAQQAVRYEFDIRVLTNNVSPASGNQLASLPAGTVGSFTIDVLNDIAVFPTDDPGFIQIYPVLDFDLSIGAVTSGPRPGVYPGIFINGVFVENDTDTNGFSQVKDNFVLTPIFENPDIGFSILYLAQFLPFGGTPSLLSSIDLPLTLDLSQTNYTPEFTLPAPSGGRVVLDVFDVTITPIPAAPTASALTLAALTAARRRRNDR